MQHDYHSARLIALLRDVLRPKNEEAERTRPSIHARARKAPRRVHKCRLRERTSMHRRGSAFFAYYRHLGTRTSDYVWPGCARPLGAWLPERARSFRTTPDVPGPLRAPEDSPQA